MTNFYRRKRILVNLNYVKEEPLTVNLDKVKDKEKRLRCRKKKSDEVDITPLKVPASVKRVEEIHKSLSKFRGNGDWDAHKNAIEGLRKEYRWDEDNAVIIKLLMYEEAAALCERNENEAAIKMVNRLGKEMKKVLVTQTSDLKHINDIHKNIYCKCLFLASKLHCIKRKFGIAQKALDIASKLLSEYNHVELEAQLYLANAYLQLCLNQSHCTLDCSTNHVIEYTNKAENTSASLAHRDPDKWEKIRRKILLIRCEAIIQFSPDNGDEKEFATVFKNSLEELEHQLWNGISHRQKVDFHIIKSNNFQMLGNGTKALDHAQQALEIAKGCRFNKEVLLLNDHCRKLEKFPGDPVNDGEGLLKKIRGIQTTTDGNAETNAAEMTDRGIFSTDDSEWENTDLFRLDGSEDVGTSLSQLQISEVPLGDNTPLSCREMYRLSQCIDADWERLAGLMNITRAERDDIRCNYVLYNDSRSRAEKILSIFNQREDFSRGKLAACFEEIQQLELIEPVITREWRT